jgi:hypothetical protein
MLVLGSRVSYNGYYVAFPRLRRGSDSRHPHHVIPQQHGISTHEAIQYNQLMTIPKQYLHDRLILLIASVNLFLSLLLALLTFLRLDTSHSSYIVQYRSNASINAFRSGNSSELFSFILFGFLVMALNTLISIRVYRIHKQLSVTVLAMGTLLLVFAIIVSNALLVLR